eukprot:scaffold4410_cov78-Cylindrotheca_fusiformis.AAC.1
MVFFQDKVETHGYSFGQQYMLQKGLKVFGEAGENAAKKELDQLHRRNCFTPVSVADMSATERKKAQQALMFLTEKRDGTKKGRAVYNGAPTREWVDREEAASPTAYLESQFLTAAIDAHEGRDVMVTDVPNAFIQADLPEREYGQRVFMKITGVMVPMLTQLAPDVYESFVVRENGREVIYVKVLKAIYGMLEAALLWYKRFRKDLESIGFKFNNYDSCVANRMVNGKQQTIRVHVDDVMSSHKYPKVNDKFLKWMNKSYGKHGKVKATRGKIHDYLSMTYDFTEPGKVKIRMDDYIEKMLKEFPVQLKSTDIHSTPAGNNLFEKGSGKLLDKQRQEAFHKSTAQGLFVSKRARPDIHPTVSTLCACVIEPNESDWQKLLRLMKYLNGTKKDHLTLSIDNLWVIKWYVDASFAVHPDFKSHSGGVMSMGGGALFHGSRKQKLNTRSSTEAELVGVDDYATNILWTKLFLEEQGYPVERNVLHQDNKSAILLEVNGQKSAGKRSHAINIRYFFITDQVKKGNISIEYCPTDDMIADYMTKPLQGEKFRKFKRDILGQ